MGAAHPGLCFAAMLYAAPHRIRPPRARLQLWLVALALLACGENGSTNETGAPDHGLDAIQPPDIPLDDGAVGASIGAPCDPSRGDQDCLGGTVCLDLSGGSATPTCEIGTGLGCGVCALPGCTVENIDTPAIEDTCPTDTVCTVVPVLSGSKTFCLGKCVPGLDENPCAEQHAGLTCHPASIVLTGHTEVCIYPACSKDEECGNKDPLDPDSICLTASGMCLVKGDPQAKVGAPCMTSSDCGPYQSCLVQQKDSSGKTVFEGGYCTVIGCKYNETFNDPKQPYWKCPPDSKCFLMGSGQFVSFCLATNCEPSKPKASDGCRDEATAGQYDCIELGTEKVCWLDIQQ